MFPFFFSRARGRDQLFTQNFSRTALKNETMAAATRAPSLSRSSSGAMKPSRSLSLEYPLDLIPAGGSEVVRSSAAPIKHENKDAAGHYFHEFALRQAGVVGKLERVFFLLPSLSLNLPLQGQVEGALSSHNSQAWRCERADVICGDGGAKERRERTTTGRRRSEKRGRERMLGTHSTAAASAVGSWATLDGGETALPPLSCCLSLSASDRNN